MFPDENLSARQLIDAFRVRKLSPVEVIQAAARRIDQINPSINALTTLCLDRALIEARASERRYLENKALPLDGVPFVAKDLLDTAGIRTTYGAVHFADHIPTKDAVAVERLRTTGAILLGKAATHEFGWGITTTGRLHGPTRNPWNLDRVPGGSSGGSAAALAAGLVPIAIGSDTAGSIRIPSAFCGTAGLKPTRARIPVEGATALAPSLDHIGPMARVPSDLPLVLAAMDGRLAGQASSDFSQHNPTDLRGLRIGVVRYMDTVELASDHAAVFDRVLSRLRSLGAEIIEIAWPLPQLSDPYAILAPMILAEAHHYHQLILRTFPERKSEYSNAVLDRLKLAGAITSSAYFEAVERRADFRSGMERILSQVDAIVSPVSAGSPASIGTDYVDHRGSKVEFRKLVMSYTAPQSLSGLPSCAVRAGFDIDGLPIGIQFTGRAWDDDRILWLSDVFGTSDPEISQRWPKA